MSDYGWLSILPPVLAIAMALRTRQVYMSLFGGILLGTTMLAEPATRASLVQVFDIMQTPESAADATTC